MGHIKCKSVITRRVLIGHKRRVYRERILNILIRWLSMTMQNPVRWHRHGLPLCTVYLVIRRKVFRDRSCRGESEFPVSIQRQSSAVGLYVPGSWFDGPTPRFWIFILARVVDDVGSRPGVTKNLPHCSQSVRRSDRFKTNDYILARLASGTGRILTEHVAVTFTRLCDSPSHDQILRLRLLARMRHSP